MGFGAVAGLIGGLGSAAGGIIGALTKKGTGGTSPAEESSRINEAANQFLLPFTGMNNAFWNLDIPAMAEESIVSGFSRVPPLNQANMQQLQLLLSQALPGYQGMVSGMAAGATDLLGGATTQSLLRGDVPADVVNQIQRGAAYQSVMGGTAGAGPATIQAITARDLGLTSLNLMQQGMGREQAGFTQTSNLLSLARNYLMPQPINPLSLLPLNDLIYGQTWSKQANYQANLAAFNAKAAAAAAGVGAPSPNAAAGIGGAIGGLLGSQSFQDLGSKIFGGGGGGDQPGVTSFSSDMPDDFAGFDVAGF